MTGDETLLIVGASARAAAYSALRAGWRVAAVNLFSDADLQAICPVWQVPLEEYPAGLVAAAQQAPPGPWLYCGGLENHPDIVATISRERELLGVAAQWLRLIRNPTGFAHQLELWGFPTTTLCAKQAMPDSGSWLLKPRRSSGGRHIRRYDTSPYPTSDENHYWSRFVEGMSQSAVYLFTDQDARLLGVNEQLIGTPWSGGGDWLYCGNIGPLSIHDGVREQYERLGERLASTGWLRGLVGVDAVLDNRGIIHPLEINPRYTASMELLERAGNSPLLRWHVAACREGQLPEPDECAHEDSLVHGKAILYATAHGTITRAFADWCSAQNLAAKWPALADLPLEDTPIERGQPLLTVFASGGCAEETRFALRKRAEQVFASL